MQDETAPALQVQEDLKNLLRFVQQLLATRDKRVFDIAEYPLKLTERDLLDRDGSPLPGIKFAASDDRWISFDRLQEIRPPLPAADLQPWLREETRPTPDKPPALKQERVVQVTAEEATDLIEANLASIDSVGLIPTDNAREAERWAVPLRPSELPLVVEAHKTYVDGPWTAWAAQEAPRRRAIRFYEGLYKAQAQISAAGGDGGQELVIGIGLASWKPNGTRLIMPLIEQRAEFELDESNGTLSILPRDVSPTVSLAPFMELGITGAPQLQRDMTSRLEQVAKDPDISFSPFQPASFKPILETCAARLDSSATVLSPEEELGVPGNVLRISPTFCIIVRTRRSDIITDDINRLIAAVEKSTWLPETGCRFVMPTSDRPIDDNGQIDPTYPLGGTNGSHTEDRDGRWSDGRAKAGDWLYFPLPANEEQEEIARRLDRPDVHGVIVQGPPGTGKTHTIANIIGHWMATGRRILVAAHTAEALTAIREKLPPTLRDLSIAVTQSDREGARQLEHAVSTLARRVQSINPRELKRQVDDLLRAITASDQRVSEIDAELAAIARENLTERPWRGSKALPHEIAAWKCSQGERHAWFPDTLDLLPHFEARFGGAEIDEARALRLRLGEDIAYRVDAIPPGSDGLPGLGTIVAAHRALRAAVERQSKETDGELVAPDASAATPGEFSELADWLERLAAWRDGCSDHVWMHRAWETVTTGQPFGRLGKEDLRARLTEASRLAERGDALALLALELGEVEQEDRLSGALAKLADGRKPFGIFGRFGRSPVRDVIDSARTASAPPRKAEDWQKLLDLHVWRRDAREFAAQWNALASHHGLSALPREDAASRAALIRLGQLASEMLTLAALAQTRIARLGALFPYGLEPAAVVLRFDVSVAIASLRASLGDADLVEAKRLRNTLRGLADRIGESLGEALHETAEALGSAEIADAAVAARWRQIHAEADRLAGQCDNLRRLSAVAALVRSSGAPRWAAEMERRPPNGDDQLLPADWSDAWDYARATGFLARIADRAAVEKLTHERAELVALRENRFLQAIEALTFLGLRSRLTENVLAALNQFLAALAKMPKTAGAVTAVRYRRILRDSLQRAVKAIPCWIMPEWRVAEQLPPELGSFDLVVIDEASQSNIMALPVVLRGKKILIVGDDKQVSPVAVGIEDSVIHRLRATYLVGQPLAEQIDPGTSLYELGTIMYPGKLTVLLDHFRCVEPIIRFSSRFYNDGLRPLRLPKPSERIDPSLIDILVEDGARRGEENEAEAAIIVEEIRQIIVDTRLNERGKRSIGVISLHASRQAKRIYDLLIETIGPEAMDAHRVMCGDAATFQGQERDIIFLSMVHDAATATKQSSRMYEQRYNVALSRARDRMVLVRSVTSSSLKEGDIKLDVLRHFQNPMAAGTIGNSDDVLNQSQSEFEREFGKRLLTAGYRVQAQVRAGGYYIDFVVEGPNDRRLAIELDGDRFHGPERWAHDVMRQKSLERLGWTFWRCWASEWEADKEGVFGSLLRTLERHGIGPIGAVSTSDILPVEHRSVRHRPKPPERVDGSPADGTFFPASTTRSSSAAPLSPIATCVAAQSVPDDDIRPDASYASPLFTRTPPGAPATARPELAESTRRVAIGDQVLVRYADGKGGAKRFEIVGNGAADGRTRIAWNSPLATAILGLQIEDEGEFMVDGTLRTVIVEGIREPVHSPTA